MQDSDYYDEILPHQYAMSEMGGNPMKGFRNRWVMFQPGTFQFKEEACDVYVTDAVIVFSRLNKHGFISSSN